MTRYRTPILAAAAALAIWPLMALAHPLVQDTFPLPNRTMPSTLPEVRVTFNEAVYEHVVTAELLGPDKKPVKARKLKSADGGKTIILPINQKLAPGGYRMTWRIVDDEHDISNGFNFKVGG